MQGAADRAFPSFRFSFAARLPLRYALPPPGQGSRRYTDDHTNEVMISS